MLLLSVMASSALLCGPWDIGTNAKLRVHVAPAAQGRGVHDVLIVGRVGACRQNRANREGAVAAAVDMPVVTSVTVAPAALQTEVVCEAKLTARPELGPSRSS